MWHSADTLEELVTATEVDAAELTETVAGYTGYAGPRGPGRALVPVDHSPFHALRLLLGDLATKGGLRTYRTARVQGVDESVVPGSCPTGNTVASVAGPYHPGPGTPVGSVMVFGYHAARARVR
ncbi:FAD-binding protein [Streptomyces sp. WAC05374]|uniref:FAD-binding protein n=1 Tax=Streptomyces sp. WAC05374 TaxID=2487420 RepID=UPI00163B81DD